MQTEAIELVVVYNAEMERELVKAQQRQPEIAPLAPVDDRRSAVRALLAQYQGQWWSINAMAQTLRMDRRLVISRVNVLVYAGLVTRRHPPITVRGRANGIMVHRGQAQGYRWNGQ